MNLQTGAINNRHACFVALHFIYITDYEFVTCWTQLSIYSIYFTPEIVFTSSQEVSAMSEGDSIYNTDSDNGFSSPSR